MTLYHRDPSQFPTNNAAETVSDPAVQLARDAGNLPPDQKHSDDVAELRHELATMRDLCVAADIIVSRAYILAATIEVDIEAGPRWVLAHAARIRIDLLELTRKIESLRGKAVFARQLSENLEDRHGQNPAEPPVSLLVACQNLYALVGDITNQPGGLAHVLDCGLSHLAYIQLMSEARAAIAYEEDR